VAGRHRYLAVPYFVLLALGLWFILRRGRDLSRLTQILNLTSLALVLAVSIQIGAYFVKTSAVVAKVNASGNVVIQADAKSLPDVYIIVMDTYSRADVLQSEFGLDNQPFLNDLQNMGFYVPQCSRSNYDSTHFSLASMLNMDYLSTFGTDFGSGGKDEYKLPGLVKGNEARQRLETLGYKVVAFDSGYDVTDWWDADLFLQSNDKPKAMQEIQPFEALLIKNTVALIAVDSQFVMLKQALAQVRFPFQDHITRVNYTFDTLDKLASFQGPKLVFAHILVPHIPLVFDAQGNVQTDEGFYGMERDPINKDYYLRGYADEVQYANSRLAPILKDLISQSATPPVIILMGDTGFSYGGKTSFDNLMAIYLPGGNEGLYPSISNVNVFRVILNKYFGGRFDLLPDVSLRLDENSKTGFSPEGEDMPDCLKK
jgi:hypothetical protein